MNIRVYLADIWFNILLYVAASNNAYENNVRDLQQEARNAWNLFIAWYSGKLCRGFEHVRLLCTARLSLSNASESRESIGNPQIDTKGI